MGSGQRGWGVRVGAGLELGEEVVILHGVPGQDLLRDVLIVRDGQLFKLRFVLPDPTNAAAVEGFDHLYALVIDSFTFLPRPL